MTTEMAFAAAQTTEQNLPSALDALLAQLSARLGDLTTPPIDLAVVFLTPHFVHDAPFISQYLHQNLSPTTLLGCAGQGVIGQHEIEDIPAITLIAGRLPNVQLTPFALQPPDWQEFIDNPIMLDAELPVSNSPELILLLADPFSVPIVELLDLFNVRFHGVPVVGGMVSAAAYANGNVLFFNDLLLSRGAIGVALSGDLTAEVIVSQGCRPIGQPLRVTQCHQNFLMRLNDEPPLAYIQSLYNQLPITDRLLMQTGGLYLGRAIHNDPDQLGRGDFVVRGVMGMDPESGAIAIGDVLHPGEYVQFHLRDATTATEDLEMMLAPQAFSAAPRAALLFNCNGRGQRLYNRPNGDVTVIHDSLGDDLPLAGFFCAGEIGPIGSQNLLHSHTASLVLLRPRRTTARTNAG